jgi:hypothetical protein
MSTRQEIKMKIQEIIAANKLRQQEAKKLNVRAGETLFKVFSIAELTAWVMERLSGARRLTEIVNAETLRLPELDQTLVGKILTDNPDKIVVLGREVAVEYSDYRREPLIRIDFRGDQSKDWARLPVEGVRLPSNREVVLYSAIDGHSYYIEAPSSQFAPKVREIFNKQQWEKFVAAADKPTITIPDPATTSNTYAPSGTSFRIATSRETVRYRIPKYGLLNCPVLLKLSNASFITLIGMAKPIF